METVFAATRTFLNQVIDFCLGTRHAPFRVPASDSHLHWDCVVRTWR